MKKIFLAATLATMFVCGAGNAQEIERYSEHVRKEGIPTQILKNAGELTTHFTTLAEGKGLAIYEFVGFSGASYSDIEAFKADFAQMVLDAVQNTKQTVGGKAVTGLVLGGTVEGFGVGYDVIEELKNSGKLKAADVLVGGLVASQAVGYHMEGIEKGWGDVISPKQDALVLVETLVNERGEKSWELVTQEKGFSQTIDVLIEGKNTNLVLFEGGRQAFTEIIEFLLRSSMDSSSEVTRNLILRVGYEAGKPQKDSGHRAASLTALAIHEYPELAQNKNLNVVVEIVGSDKKMSVSEFFKSEAGKALLADVEVSKNKMFELMSLEKESQTPEQKRSLALLEVNSTVQKYVNKVGEAFQNGLIRSMSASFVEKLVKIGEKAELKLAEYRSFI